MLKQFWWNLNKRLLYVNRCGRHPSNLRLPHLAIHATPKISNTLNVELWNTIFIIIYIFTVYFNVDMCIIRI